MVYEHQKEVRIAGDSGIKIVELLTDKVDDQKQVADLMLQSANAIGAVLQPLAEEDKGQYKAKFLVAVSLYVARKEIKDLGLDEKSAAALTESLLFAARLIDIYLPDSES